MSEHFKEEQHNAIIDSGVARVIPCKKLALSDPFHWLALGIRDAQRAPVLTLFFGVIFAAIPWFITYLVELTGWHLVIMPAIVCFILLGPFLAAGLYDVSWELEKHHVPSLWHSVKAIKRNAVNEWGLGIMLLVLMIFWLRVASVIHALYPEYLDPNWQNLLPFLAVGTVVGAGFTLLVFFLCAFTQPILMERKVDLATAVLTSMNAVWSNKGPMLMWAMIILTAVLIGFATWFIGFLILMPLIGYATWHGYIDTIETKRERHFE
ncbi:MAG: DUF2189 domain-containing protein [Paraglaciecola sp.]|nr:DUF2189 domain-containing protein [Paraglaciecola sp.]NCT48953.1 DUF2189 domain-containing protein [Paraglaciecola sp.]